MRVKCLAQEHNTMPRLVLEPGPLDPESSALTTRPPRLFIIHFFKVKDTRDEYLCNFTLDSSNQHQQQENTSILITRFLNYKHRSLCFDSTAPFQAILFYVTGGGGGAGGVFNQVLYGDAPHRGRKLTLLYTTFDQKVYSETCLKRTPTGPSLVSA